MAGKWIKCGDCGRGFPVFSPAGSGRCRHCGATNSWKANPDPDTVVVECKRSGCGRRTRISRGAASFVCPGCGKTARVGSTRHSESRSGSNSARQTVSFAQAARRYADYYSNPFWTDPTDPTLDPLVLAVLENLEYVETENQRRRNSFVPRDFSELEETKTRVFGIGVLLFLGGFGALLLGVSVGFLMLALAGFVMMPLAILIVVWQYIFVSDERRKEQGRLVLLSPDSGLRATVKAASMRRYSTWKEILRGVDPHLHGQVVLWEQQQEVIQNQQRIISRQDQMLIGQAEAIRLQQETVTAQRKTNESLEQMRRDAEARWRRFQERQSAGWY